MKAIFLANHMDLKVLVLLLFLANTISGRTIVPNLPGYGNLSFTLETGYVGVGDNDDVQMFYYFVESENDPSKDPILLWITGGPSCSSLAGFFYESGPLTIDINNYEGEDLPTLIPNEYAWTKNLSVIYLDGPVGTGFSYSKSSNYSSSDPEFAENVFEFLKKWFEIEEHTQFKQNGLYLGGDGYSGKIVTLTVNSLINGEPALNTKGLVIGNPGTDNNIDFQAQVDISYYLGLISEKLYNSVYESCDGNFTATNVSAECTSDKAKIQEMKDNLDPTNVLIPKCPNGLPTTNLNSGRRSLAEKSKAFSILQADNGVPFYTLCTDYIHNVTQKWVNNAEVRAALNIEEGTVDTWIYCNNSLNDGPYNKSVTSVLSYHQNFIKSTNLQALIYSGDHDISIPHMSTRQWIHSMESLTEVYDRRPWLVDYETAGYTVRFTNNERYNLTFATVKGGGHYAAEDKVKECSVMVKKWLANIAL